MVPSTLPSTYKSSLPESSPLITTDLPMCANSPVFGMSILRSPFGSTLAGYKMEYRILNHLANPVGEEEEYGGEKVCTVTADIPLEIGELAFWWRVSWCTIPLGLKFKTQ